MRSKLIASPMTMPVRHDFRPDIQGLRAVAVVLVVVFHVWPHVLPGGYVGVDVFFVISGYLITGLLLREAERTGRISLVEFYGKRIKRLLPAATAVLLAVAVCLSVLPIVRWSDTANEIAASALYFENWWLAAKAVDYLASESAPSPLQHYWSLSVEEQFYIAWPLLFAGGVAAARRLGWSRRAVFGALVCAIGVVSFAYSVYITPRNPGLAYFATTTRAWELALGGGLALYTLERQVNPLVQKFMGAAGMAMIAASGVAYGEGTSFPGYHALLPTLGAALLIVSGETYSRFSVNSVLRGKAFQYVGDLSYSLYLWHWPVVVFYREISGRSLGLVDGVIVAGVSLALAHQTKVLIEDVFRSRSFASAKVWQPFSFASVCIAAILACWGAIHFQVERHSGSNVNLSRSTVDYPGALALSDQLPTPSVDNFVPSALSAKEDKGDPYVEGCIASVRSTEMKECFYGDRDADVRVVLVGDSHAVHWVPALQVVVENAGASLSVLTKSACPVAQLSQEAPESDQYKSCLSWSKKVTEKLLSENATIVIFAHSRNSFSALRKSREESAEVLANGMVQLWEKLGDQGKLVFAIRDTPRFVGAVPDCLARQGGTVASCSRTRASALSPVDPILLSAAAYDDVRLIDLTDAICNGPICSPVVGNVVAWRDAHHMTASFARTLAPALSRALAPALPVLDVDRFTTLIQADQANAAGLHCADARCGEEIRPALAVARKDKPAGYARGCHLGLEASEPEECSFGAKEGKPVMFVVGDSHAGQWMPAYAMLAEEKGWHVRSFTKAACAFSDTEVLGGRARDVPYEACTEWNKNIVEIIERERPDIVLVSQSAAYRVADTESPSLAFERLVNGYVSRWEWIEKSGDTKVLVLADTPRLGIDVPECLSRDTRGRADCSRSSRDVLDRKDPTVAAATERRFPVITMNDRICPGETCPPVIGDVLVWRDSHHVSATFAAEVAQVFGERVERTAAAAMATSAP